VRGGTSWIFNVFHTETISILNSKVCFIRQLSALSDEQNQIDSLIILDGFEICLACISQLLLGGYGQVSYFSHYNCTFMFWLFGNTWYNDVCLHWKCRLNPTNQLLFVVCWISSGIGKRRAMWPLCKGTGTTDWADHIMPGSGPLNPISRHLTLV